jgi:alpha-tubulin suppressor-like RCC1 family protein
MVACGGFHSLVVTQAGQVFAFGRGDKGQLGLGDKENRKVPVQVGQECFRGAIIAHAAAGEEHSGVVTADGAVWTWGCGEYGRLGHGDEEDALVPRELEEQFGGARALSLAAGEAHTMVLTMRGAVWGFGFGLNGRLGFGNSINKYTPEQVGDEATFGNSKVRMVACGTLHTLAVTEDGAVLTWGSGSGGKLGHNDNLDRLVPTRVGPQWFGGKKVVLACGGDKQSVAVLEDNTLFTWGHGGCAGITYGLGHGDLADKFIPTMVSM